MGRPDLVIDVEEEKKRITEFIERECRNFRRDGALLGVTGGLDSAVTAALAVEALGKDRVAGVTTPERDTDPRSFLDARAVADWLDIKLEIYNITMPLRQMGAYRLVRPTFLMPRDAQANYVKEVLGEAAQFLGRPLMLASMQGVENSILAHHLAFIRAKNRVRMAYHYLRAEAQNLLLLTTTTRSKWMTGLFVKYGDGAGDIAPIAHLYKVQVRQLAEHLNVPERIRRKQPSPDLAPGLVDEDLLSLPYEKLDPVIDLVAGGASDEEIGQMMAIDQRQVKFVRDLISYSEHQRHMPVMLDPPQKRAYAETTGTIG